MCRFIVVKSKREIEITPYLEKFAYICKHSKVYQGDGWGLASLEERKVRLYKSINPIWKDRLDKFGRTSFFVAHARSSFSQQYTGLKYNMPFWDGEHVFVFNGELRGVRLNVKGEIGAKKIFNLIKSFQNGDMLVTIKNVVELLKIKTRNIKAINFVISDLKRIYVNSYFTEDPEYFSLYYKRKDGMLLISSEPLPGENNWEKIENNTQEVFEWLL